MLTQSSEVWCHYEDASSYTGYGITWNAPRFPIVIPAVLYRNLIRPWWSPIGAVLIWIWRTLYSCFLGIDEVKKRSATAEATRIATKVLFREQAGQILEEDGGYVPGMAADEVI